MIEGLLYHGLTVWVSERLPFESTDPDRPGTVHAVRETIDGKPVLLVSAELLRTIKLKAFRDKSRAWFRRSAA